MLQARTNPIRAGQTEIGLGNVDDVVRESGVLIYGDDLVLAVTVLLDDEMVDAERVRLPLCRLACMMNPRVLGHRVASQFARSANQTTSSLGWATYITASNAASHSSASTSAA